MSGVKEVTIIQMAKGALEEQLTLATTSVLKNIQDLNTKATAVRKIKVEIAFKPNEERDQVSVTATCEPKLEPRKATETTIFVEESMEGELRAMEFVKGHAAGQTAIDGNDIPESKKLRLA